MARLRLRLIRFGDRDGLETSEATRTRGRLPSVAAGARTDTTWRSREIVGIRNWVLGTEWGIGFAPSYSLRELVQFLVQEWSNQPSGWQDFQTQFRRLHCQ